MKVNNYKLFPTFISHIECYQFDTIKDDLLKWIYDYQNSQVDYPIVSNRGGWQSYNDFFYYESDFNRYLTYIEETIQLGLSFYNFNFKIKDLWISINKPGDYNIMHHHHRIMSGVLWVSTPENCGNMVFVSPNSFTDFMMYRNIDRQIADEHGYCEQKSFTPQEGTMLIFPSSLNHFIEANQSDQNRVTITFNLEVE